MNGFDLVIVQEILGHKSIVMTKRYSHPTPEHKKKAVESVAFNKQKQDQSTVINIKELYSNN